MYIFEEYITRIGIKSNIIRYAEKSFVFLRKDCYELVQINKTPNNAKFEFVVKKINKDSKNKRNEVDWNDYEDYINKNLRGIKNAIEDKDEVFISSWEMFLIQNQSHFCKNYSHNFIYNTIDLSFSKNQRIENIHQSVFFIKSNCDSIYNLWKNLQEGLKNYSYWLAAIINEPN